jgi:hypothetical protein
MSKDVCLKVKLKYSPSLVLFKNVVAKDLLHKFQLPIAPYAYEQPLEWEEFKIKIPQSFAC